ncbi:hypothetical protein JCM5353_005051 [Sporobolomyces roseus]
MSGDVNPKPMILSEPANSAVTRLVDSGLIGSGGFGPYSRKLVTALPNLRRIVIEQLRLKQTPEAAWQTLEFEEATKNISEYEIRLFQMSAKREVARYLRSNPSILRYISISHETAGDKPYFDNEDDPSQLEALSSCPGLTKLVLSGFRFSDRINESSQPSTVPFFASALSYPFLFANSLTSLSLSRRSIVDFSTPIDASFLTLASLFPNLTHLRLEAEGTIIDDSPFAITGSFSFPSLRSLEISLQTFEPTVKLLSTLSLPSVQLLRLLFEVDSTTTDHRDFSPLAEPLTRFNQTLRVLDLKSTHSTHRTELDTLAKRILPHCQVRTNWKEGDVRHDATLAETELERLVAEAKRCGDWIVEEAERAGKEGSLTNAKDLLASLKEVKARRNWMEM